MAAPIKFGFLDKLLDINFGTKDVNKRILALWWTASYGVINGAAGQGAQPLVSLSFIPAGTVEITTSLDQLLIPKKKSTPILQQISDDMLQNLYAWSYKSNIITTNNSSHETTVTVVDVGIYIGYVLIAGSLPGTFSYAPLFGGTFTSQAQAYNTIANGGFVTIYGRVPNPDANPLELIVGLDSVVSSHQQPGTVVTDFDQSTANWWFFNVDAIKRDFFGGRANGNKGGGTFTVRVATPNTRYSANQSSYAYDGNFGLWTDNRNFRVNQNSTLSPNFQPAAPASGTEQKESIVEQGIPPRILNFQLDLQSYKVTSSRN